MAENRREALQDLSALLSVLVFVLGSGICLFLLMFYTVLPSVVGPLDQPIPNLVLIIPSLLAFAIVFAAGGLVGGTLWLVVMSRFLPKRTMHKWLTYGPQIRPLLKLNLRLLDALYAKNERAL
jgi:membrane associated rhomboid family serine protease